MLVMSRAKRNGTVAFTGARFGGSGGSCRGSGLLTPWPMTQKPGGAHANDSHGPRICALVSRASLATAGANQGDRGRDGYLVLAVEGDRTESPGLRPL